MHCAFLFCREILLKRLVDGQSRKPQLALPWGAAAVMEKLKLQTCWPALFTLCKGREGPCYASPGVTHSQSCVEM